ncbi:hypothetical protein ACJMK2_027794 [Sinanodonta woodiana]|uniref:NB-ARC domain-containing protein n=1 Tax=Sinanodonta woodiana TaxID=1069815 RepID=A0ABD3X509_SINWO
MQEESDITYDTKSVWEKIKDKLDDELDDHNTLEVYTLMKDKMFLPMDVDITHPRQILEHLENNYSEKECFEILRNVFNLMHLHVVSEGKTFSEVINEYEKQLPGDRKDLIGRDKQIHDVMKILVENKCKGVWLCGMGGMGKTTLAEEICYRLQDNHSYKFLKVNMKGKNSIVDLSQEILIAQNLMWREYGERMNELEPPATSSKESILNLQVRQSLRNFTYESVLLLDNMDDLQRKDGKNLSLYVTELLSGISELGEQCKLKVIITARHKLIDSLVETEPNSSSGNGEIHLREIEIGGLSEEDGQKLAMKSAAPRKLEVQECSQLVKVCGGSPLAIDMMSRYIRRRWNDPVTEVLNSIKHSHSDIVECCIENSFDDLPHETKEQFIQLFVFNVCPFNVQSAAAIWFEDTSELSIAKAEMVLLQFKHRHMVECGRPCNPKIQGLLVNGEMDTVTYSLHPLVFSSRDTLLRREGLANSMNLSKARFLELYLNKLVLLEERLERERNHAHQIVSSDKVHFQDIFMWNSTLTFSTASNLKLIYSLGIKTNKLLTTFAKLINKAEEALKVFKNLAKNSKELNNADAFVFWSVQQAEACLDCNKDDKALKILQHLPIEGQDYSEPESTNDVYKLFTAAEFHYVRGMLFNKSKDYCKALRELDKSLELYKTCKPEESFTVYQAAAINARGNVHFKLKDYSSALKCHQSAYDLIIGRVGRDFHEHKAIYLHNIGSIYHAEALQKWDKNKSKENGLLDKALKTYDECINQDVDNKQTSDSYYAERLRIRSDIYLRKKQFDEAIADCETALKVQINLHVKKHPSITISRYQLARCYMKRANECWKEYRKDYGKTEFKGK